MLRARSSWSSLFDFLVAEDLVEGNPMAPAESVPTAPAHLHGPARLFHVQAGKEAS